MRLLLLHSWHEDAIAIVALLRATETEFARAGENVRGEVLERAAEHVLYLVGTDLGLEFALQSLVFEVLGDICLEILIEVVVRVRVGVILVEGELIIGGL